MPTRSRTVTPLNTFGEDVHIVSWTGLLNGDDGTPLEMPGSADRSVQVHGTFGSGGTLLIEGSNDGVNYYTLNDPSSSALSVTSAKIETILEITRYIRPRVSAGDVTTSLTCTMLVRKPVR